MTEFTTPRNHKPSGLPRIEGDRAVVEQAKGALMLRYAISSHEAFALLLIWSRSRGTTLHTIAHTLVNGVRQGADAELHDPALVGWLRERLDQDVAWPR